jgi:hypothetical protein
MDADDGLPQRTAGLAAGAFVALNNTYLGLSLMHAAVGDWRSSKRQYPQRRPRSGDWLSLTENRSRLSPT